MEDLELKSDFLYSTKYPPIKPTSSILDIIKKNSNEVSSVQWVVDTTDSTVIELSNALWNNNNITSLELWDDYYTSSITDSSLSKLFKALKRNNCIVQLELHWCALISNKATKQLTDLISASKSLNFLYLGGCQLGHEFVVQIMEATKKRKCLTHLNVSYNCLGAVGATTLSKSLSGMDYLTHLDLANNKIDCEGLEALGKALGSHSTIVKIELGWNNIQEQGTIALAEALKCNTSLKVLKMCGNMVGDRGAASLSNSFIYNHTLQVVQLDKVSIRDEGLQALEKSLDFNYSLIELTVGDLGSPWEESVQRNRNPQPVQEIVEQDVAKRRTINFVSEVQQFPGLIVSIDREERTQYCIGHVDLNGQN